MTTKRDLLTDTINDIVGFANIDMHIVLDLEMVEYENRFYLVMHEGNGVERLTGDMGLHDAYVYAQGMNTMITLIRNTEPKG